MSRNGRTEGWIVLAAGAVGVFMTTPGQTVGVAAFVDPIASDLAIAREQVVMLYSIGTLLGILPAPLIGRLVDRYGPRRAIAVIAPALGCLVIPGAAEQVTDAYGWRASYLTLGAAVVLIMLPVGLLGFRNRPQTYGLTPDFGGDLSARASVNRQDFTLGEAIRTKLFWYLLSISILANAIGTALLLDHVRALQSAGVARSSAVGLLGVVTVTQAVCVLGGGVLVDKYGTRKVGLLGLLLLASAVIYVMFAPAFLSGSIYAAALGAGLGVLHVV